MGTVRSSSSKIVVVGYGFFILICGATFTANTAAFLVVRAERTSQISSIEDAISKRKTVCAFQATSKTVKMAYPGVILNEVKNTDAMYEAYRGGMCDAIIAAEALVATGQSKNELCDLFLVGKPISTIPVSMPV